MANNVENGNIRGTKFWIVLLGLIILLVFLYFYKPFETFLTKSIPEIHFSNVIFWFVSLVGLIAYGLSHWASFRQNIVRGVSDLETDGLVFETLQIAILVAVILCAGATIQAIEMLAEHLIAHGSIIGAQFGSKIVSIVLLVIMAVLFYLLHHAVRGFRTGWHQRRPPRVSSSGD